MKSARIGCSGWNYRDWRGDLYPETLPQSRWLERYGEIFDTVEVNNTFYRLPTQEAVEHWAEATPRSFRFSIKASRYLTHVKRLNPPPGGTTRLYERLEPLIKAKKMGPMLWQLPANFRRDDERLAEALERLPDGLHCFEFRHESWFCDEVYALLRRHRVALVISDHPERPFQSHELTAPFTVIRFHHGHRGRGGNYSDSELEEWAERINRMREKAEVWAYFNNDSKPYAPRNASRLAAALA